MTRQLATMVNSGMTILRALYVLEAQTENEQLAETIVDVRKDVEAGLPLSRRARAPPQGLQPAVRRDDARGGDRRHARRRAAARRRPAREGRLAAPPGQGRDGLPAASSWPSPFGVLIALVAFLVPVFVGVFKQFGGELPDDHQVHRRAVATRSRATGIVHRSAASRVDLVRSASGRRSDGRPQAVGHVQPAHPDEDRRHRPEGRAGPLVAHASALWSAPACRSCRRSTSPAKTAGNHVVEKAMGDVIESVSSGGTIAAPLKDAPVFPGMVTHMVGVGEETGALDTMLSKIADFYEDQVDAAVKPLDLDPRAGDDRPRRRHRRLHRHLDVHAALQGLRLDQVGARTDGQGQVRRGRPPGRPGREDVLRRLLRRGGRDAAVATSASVLARRGLGERGRRGRSRRSRRRARRRPRACRASWGRAWRRRRGSRGRARRGRPSRR